MMAPVATLSDTERRLWEAADEFRANSDLKSSEYATPVLGLIFLRYADHRFSMAEEELEGTLCELRASVFQKKAHEQFEQW